MINMCFSGGARGADTIFSKAAFKVGHQVRHMSFMSHEIDPSIFEGEIIYLTIHQLEEADPYVKKAAKTIGKNVPTDPFVKNLIRRNFWQIRETERVYAVAPLDVDGHVTGGTGWAVQMAIDRSVPHVWVFDLTTNKWFWRNQIEFGGGWEERPSVPRPAGFYTGIGSRYLTPEGKEAIRCLYEV